MSVLLNCKALWESYYGIDTVKRQRTTGRSDRTFFSVRSCSSAVHSCVCWILFETSGLEGKH